MDYFDFTWINKTLVDRLQLMPIMNLKSVGLFGRDCFWSIYIYIRLVGSSMKFCLSMLELEQLNLMELIILGHVQGEPSNLPRL